MIFLWICYLNLGISTQHEFLNNTDNSQDPIQNTVCKYKNHPSIISIKKYMEGANFFYDFENATKDKKWKIRKKPKYQKSHLT